MCQIKKITVKISKITMFFLSWFLNWEHLSTFSIYVQGTCLLLFPGKKRITSFSEDSLFFLNCVCQTTSVYPTKSSLSWLSRILKRIIQIAIVQMKEGNFQEENLDSFVFLHIQFPYIQSLFLNVFTITPQYRDFWHTVVTQDTMPLPQFLLPLALPGSPNCIINRLDQSQLSLTSLMFTHPSYSIYSLYYFCNHTSKYTLSLR